MAEARKAVEDLVRLSSRVIRILGQNPGPYTLAGTNTYLVSTPPVASSSLASRPSVLVDTGEGTDGYIPLLERALKGAVDGDGLTKNSNGKASGSKREDAMEEDEEDEDDLTSWISDIVLTHKHHDHVGGLPSILSLLSKLRAEATVTLPAPRIHKFLDAESDPDLIKMLQNLPKGSFIPCEDGGRASPLWPLREGSTVSVTGPDASSSLQVLHTPGHTADHICLLLTEEKTLLTGDHVLGQGTTVFEDLTAYMSSLRKCSRALEELGPSSNTENRLYPAHGPVVEEGNKMLKQYLDHRLEREAQVVELLKTSPDSSEETSSIVAIAGAEHRLGSPWKIRQMVLKLYSNYPENLFPAAARGLYLHLRTLSSPDPEQGRASRVRCLQTTSFARRGSAEAATDVGNCPPLPRSDAEWVEAMELDWALIVSQQEGTATNHQHL